MRDWSKFADAQSCLQHRGPQTAGHNLLSPQHGCHVNKNHTIVTDNMIRPWFLKKKKKTENNYKEFVFSKITEPIPVPPNAKHTTKIMQQLK